MNENIQNLLTPRGPDELDAIRKRAEHWMKVSGTLWALFCAAPPHGKIPLDMLNYMVDTSDPVFVLALLDMAQTDWISRYVRRLRNALGEGTDVFCICRGLYPHVGESGETHDPRCMAVHRALVDPL